MQRTNFGEMACSIARTLDVIGEPWSPLILRDVWVGFTRFEQIQADLGISRKVLTERLNHVSDAAATRVEERLARLRAALERQRDDALKSLEDRSHQVESGLRERLHEIAADAESERAVLEARLHDLGRRLDELTARA